MSQNPHNTQTYTESWASVPAWLRESFVCILMFFLGTNVLAMVVLMTIATNTALGSAPFMRLPLAIVVGLAVAIGVFRIALAVRAHLDPWRWWRVGITVATLTAGIALLSDSLGTVSLVYGAALVVPFIGAVVVPRNPEAPRLSV